MSKTQERLWTMTAIRQTNADAGLHFFEPETLRFFRSRIVSQSPHQGPAGIFFVTSERFVPSSGPAEPRRYTVREFNPATGDITTYGKFQQFKSPATAAAAARRAAAGRRATYHLTRPAAAYTSYDGRPCTVLREADPEIPGSACWVRFDDGKEMQAMSDELHAER